MAPEKGQQLDSEALISVNRATFRLILSTPENRLVETLHGLIKKGRLIIWNPGKQEFVADGDIEKASIVNGSTVKLTLVTKHAMDLQEWLES